MISVAAFLLFGCIEPSGHRITAGDLASLVPAFRALPSTTVLGYAPRPGVTRTFTGAELSRHLPPDTAAPPGMEPVCVQWQTSTPDADTFRTAMLRELPPDTTLAVLEVSGYAIPGGPIHFPVSGLRPAITGRGAMWRGYVEYAPGLRFDVWARVDVRVATTQIVPVQPIAAGTVIDPGMVRLEPVAAWPGTSGLLTRLDDVSGRQARRSLPAGMPIPANALEKRTDVRKGDPLHVKVNAGSATIGFDATALSPAVEGDTISVRINETGRTVRARIAGPGQGIVQLSGAN